MKVTAIATRHSVRFAKLGSTAFSQVRPTGAAFEVNERGVVMSLAGHDSKLVPWSNILEATVETKGK